LLRKRRTRLQLSHFQILAQVGQGGYGQVFLCKKKDTGEICALKKMSKKSIYGQNEVREGKESERREREEYTTQHG
jgi:cell cycle protein kinase DBF2